MIFYDKFSGTPNFIDDSLVESCKISISKNFEKFNEYYNNDQKLAFIKLLKEYTKLGLRDAKCISEYYLDNRNDFDLLNITYQRRKKLEKIKKNTLLRQVSSEIKNKNDEEIMESLNKLNKEDLYKVLESFGFYDKI